jgi:hypothetical protein
MKKYKWLIAGLAALFLTSAIILNISAKPPNAMGINCVEDGSCCPDENVCTCD